MQLQSCLLQTAIQIHLWKSSSNCTKWQITDEAHQSMNRRTLLDWYYMAALHFIFAFILSESLKWMRSALSLNDKLNQLCALKLKHFFFPFYFIMFLCAATTPHGRVWRHTHTPKEREKKKKVVLLRCSAPIGQSSPLKDQYLNQVKKKVQEETDGILWVAPSGPEEDDFEHCAVWFAPQQVVARERNNLMR